MDMRVTFPSDFPHKYKNAVKSTGELCSVKKHLAQAPSFDLNVHIG
jgi:ribosomal protein S12 methylthiotransferase accessory factor